MILPQKPLPQAKNKHVRFRVTEAELSSLTNQANRARLSVGELARMRTLSGNLRLVTEANSLDPAFVRQLYHIGSILSRISRGASLASPPSKRIDRLCCRIEKLMNEAIEKEAD